MKNVLENEKEILEVLSAEHTEIEECMFGEKLRQQIETTEKSSDTVIGDNNEEISVDDFENIMNAYDEINKSLTKNSSATHIASHDAVRKERNIANMSSLNMSIRRVASMSDINKTMCAPSNLNTTKMFADSQILMPPPQAPGAVESSNPLPKLTIEQLKEFNALKSQIEKHLMNLDEKENSDVTDMVNITDTFMKSYDRFQAFFREITKLKISEAKNSVGTTVLGNLDSELCDLLKKLAEVSIDYSLYLHYLLIPLFSSPFQALEQIRCLEASRHMYSNITDAQEQNYPLSNILDEILESILYAKQ